MSKELLQIVIACTLLIAVLAYFLIHFIIRHNNSVQQHLIEKERLLFELERKELRMGFEERELVLSEVSQEIHDNIGQMAHLIRRTLYTIEQYSSHEAQLEQIKYVADLSDRLIRDTRYISHSLNTDFIKGRGLYQMLEYDMERINASKETHCTIAVEGDHSLSVESQLLVYRIAQEAIHNVLRHANAGHLKIQLLYSVDYFKMVISDNGVGFDESIIKQDETMGIVNMHQRAKLLNGFLKIKSSPAKGCNVTLLIGHEEEG